MIELELGSRQCVNLHREPNLSLNSHSGKEIPASLRYNLDGATHYLYRGLVIDRICRPANACGPALGVGQSVLRHELVAQVRKDGEADHAQGAVVPARRLPVHERLTNAWRHDHASGTHANPDFFWQRWQECRQSRLDHPV